jgi:peroxiredoxin Q/BCP
MDQEGQPFSRENLLGHWSAVYFYPRDNTSGCIIEAKEFNSLAKRFMDEETQVVGISTDSVKSHVSFKAKHHLGLTLLSDPEHQLAEPAGVWQKKKLYGKEIFGLVRTTFLLDPQGIVREVWTKIKVAGHAETVLAKLRELR